MSDLRQDRIIEYEAFSRAMSVARDFMLWPPSERPPGMAIFGPTNSGKTQIAKAIEREHARRPKVGADQDAVPILFVETPPRPLEGMLYSAMIAKLIGADASAIMPATQCRQVIRLMQTLSTKILIVDNFHRVYPGHNLKGLQFAEVLLHLAAETKVHLILTGLESFGQAIQSESQLNNRLQSRIHLERWRNYEEHKAFLLTYLAELNLIKEGDSVDADFLQEVLKMAYGVLGEIVAILRCCAGRPDLFPNGPTVDGLRKLPYRAPSSSNANN